MTVTWSPLAIERTIEAAEFIALDKPAAAQPWAESIFAAVERLAAFPESGRVVPELGRPEIREIIQRGHRIVYRVEAEHVYVLTVRQSWQLFDPAETE